MNFTVDTSLDHSSERRSGKASFWILISSIVVFVVIGLIAVILVTSKTAPELLADGLDQVSLGRYGKVRIIVNDLRTRDDEDALRSADLLDGLVRLDLENYEGAIDGLALAREYPATRAHAWMATGKALFMTDRTAEAAKTLLVAIEFDPDLLEAHRMLSVIYYDLGTMDKAMRHLNEVSRLDPQDARPWRLTGLIMKDYERYSDAVPAYQKALDRCGTMELGEEISLELAECHLQLHQYREANRLLTSLNPSPGVDALKARCEFADGRFDRAEQLASSALAVETAQPDALRVLADLHLRNDQLPEAISGLKRLLKIDHGDLESRSKLSQALRQAGDIASADTELKLLTELRILRAEWAQLHQQALHDDANAELRYRLGQVAVELKHPELARDWFRAALAIDADHNGAREALVNLRSADSP